MNSIIGKMKRTIEKPCSYVTSGYYCDFANNGKNNEIVYDKQAKSGSKAPDKVTGDEATEMDGTCK